MSNHIAIETTPSMPQAERDRINAANTAPNSEQIFAAHSKALRRTDATKAERKAHIEECPACWRWSWLKASLKAERKATGA